jgi:hypothetical protein
MPNELTRRHIREDGDLNTYFCEDIEYLIGLKTIFLSKKNFSPGFVDKLVSLPVKLAETQT